MLFLHLCGLQRVLLKEPSFIHTFIHMSMKKCCCHISKQRMLQPSSHHIKASPTVGPEGTQDGNRVPPTPSSQPLPPPRPCTPRGLRMRKHRMLAPES